MKAQQARDVAMSVIQHNIKDDSFYKRIKAEIEKAAYEGKFTISFKLENEVNEEPTILYLETEGFKAFTYVDEVHPSICMCVSWK